METLKELKSVLLLELRCIATLLEIGCRFNFADHLRAFVLTNTYPGTLRRHCLESLKLYGNQAQDTWQILLSEENSFYVKTYFAYPLFP